MRVVLDTNVVVSASTVFIKVRTPPHTKHTIFVSVSARRQDKCLGILEIVKVDKSTVGICISFTAKC